MYLTNKRKKVKSCFVIISLSVKFLHLDFSTRTIRRCLD